MRTSALLVSILSIGPLLVACSSTPSHPGTLADTDSGAVDADAALDTAPAAAACSNGVKDGDETDVDCGGSCSPCANGRACKQNADCVDNGCAAGVCVTPSCTDKIKDGDETDVDCGGPSCGPCADDKACATNENCKSLVCAGGTCQAPTCTDGVRNGDESDQDCGGSCPKCTVGRRCVGADDCGSGICNASVTAKACGCPTGMIVMPTKALSGGAYCIDAHEVTMTEYNAFWTAAVSATTQTAQCRWNVNWTPTQLWPPSGTDDKPVRYVDWCDAYGYCKWAGKTLCGKIGGGSNATADGADPLKSAWYNACSAQGTNVYPNGASFDPLLCNGGAGATDVWSTKTTSCQGGATGLYDMSGDVQEWEDSCSASTGETDNCLVRGGAFDVADPALLRCDATTSLPRDTTSADTGFRCCAFY